MTGKIRTYIIIALLLLCQNILAQNKTPTTDSPSQSDLGIFALPPFERAVRCIKYYEGWPTSSATIPISGGDTGISQKEVQEEPHLSTGRLAIAF